MDKFLLGVCGREWIRYHVLGIVEGLASTLEMLLMSHVFGTSVDAIFFPLLQNSFFTIFISCPFRENHSERLPSNCR